MLLVMLTDEKSFLIRRKRNVSDVMNEVRKREKVNFACWNISDSDLVTNWVKQAMFIKEMNGVSQFISTLRAYEISAECLN